MPTRAEWDEIVEARVRSLRLERDEARADVLALADALGKVEESLTIQQLTATNSSETAKTMRAMDIASTLAVVRAALASVKR